MAKEKNIYTCTECGDISPKWLGKCPACGAWNTLIESVAESAAPAKNRFSQPLFSQPLSHPSGSQFKPLAQMAEIATLGVSAGRRAKLVSWGLCPCRRSANAS